MSALRKAGVWLGLVEEDDDRRDEGVFDDEFAEDDDDFAPPARPRSLARSKPVSPAQSRIADRRLGRESASREGREGRVADHHVADREVFRSDPRPSQRTAEPEPRSRHETSRHESSRHESSRHDPESTSRYESSRQDSRTETGRTETASVRHISRPSSGTSDRSFPTQDNLALAPQVQLRERAVVSEDKSRRYQITTLHPTSYSEARTIGEHFRDGYPVIMNLTEMDEADAKRLVDFAAGLAFGVRGSMERVTNRVFLLSPPNIQVSAEDKARIAEGGFLDQG
jgi:cell division inhibitor SepF